MLLAIYLWLSTFLLGFIASVWGTTGWANILMKLVFVVAAILGGVMIAKSVIA